MIWNQKIKNPQSKEKRWKLKNLISIIVHVTLHLHRFNSSSISILLSASVKNKKKIDRIYLTDFLSEKGIRSIYIVVFLLFITLYYFSLYHLTIRVLLLLNAIIFIKAFFNNYVYLRMMTRRHAPWIIR